MAAHTGTRKAGEGSNQRQGMETQSHEQYFLALLLVQIIVYKATYLSAVAVRAPEVPRLDVGGQEGRER